MDDRFREGIRLFNAGDFFEAHEVLEEVWLEVRGESRDFYRGLIQLAVAYHHGSERNFRGCLALFERGPKLLQPYRPWFLGVDLEAVLEQVEADRAYVERVAAGEAAWEGLRPPQILLQG